ncbi:MAG: hypothetical protein KatS3mg110_4241 [Pirellulaceae bacterium]|nr:MAG: hypothetical protein KatS3mg110_4241 [Pirellulaceae bacterium]
MQRSDELPPDDDPCIDAAGQICLDAESQALAARLAHEAIQLADQALAEPARKRLLHRIASERGQRSFLRHVASVALCAVAVMAGIWAWSGTWHRQQPAAGPSPAPIHDGARNSTAASQAGEVNLAVGPAAATEEPWPFLDAREDATAPPGMANEADRIRLLEMALERYRAAIEAQQQRIRELEAEREMLRARLAGQHPASDARPATRP